VVDITPAESTLNVPAGFPTEKTPKNMYYQYLAKTLEQFKTNRPFHRSKDSN